MIFCTSCTFSLTFSANLALCLWLLNLYRLTLGLSNLWSLVQNALILFREMRFINLPYARATFPAWTSTCLPVLGSPISGREWRKVTERTFHVSAVDMSGWRLPLAMRLVMDCHAGARFAKGMLEGKESRELGGEELVGKSCAGRSVGKSRDVSPGWPHPGAAAPREFGFRPPAVSVAGEFDPSNV